MRIVKLFEYNSFESSRRFVLDLAETSLVTLLDLDYIISMPTIKTATMLGMLGCDMIFILLPPRSRPMFKLSDVKDQFIPFLQILSRDFRLCDDSPIIIGLEQAWSGKKRIYDSASSFIEDVDSGSLDFLDVYFLSIKIMLS